MYDGVVLLVDDDQAEPAHRREDRRARTDDDARLAARDPLALVAALCLGERRVQDRDALAEALPHASHRLRCERDLRHEDDRAEPALEHRRAGLEVHLGLARAGCAVEQEVAALARDDPVDGSALRLRQRHRLRLAAERLALRRRCLLLAPLRRLRRDERERACRRRAVVVGDPERELDERRGDLADHRLDRARVDARRAARRRSQSTMPRARERPNGTRTIAPTLTVSSTS